jgi:hypothetical protein
MAKEKKMLKLAIKPILVLVGLLPFGYAASIGPTTPPPVIVSTMVDFKENVMVITGHNFGSALPIVRLANQVLRVKSYTANQVVVSLPPGIPPTTYRLTVAADGPYKLTSDVFNAALFAAADR